MKFWAIIGTQQSGAHIGLPQMMCAGFFGSIPSASEYEVGQWIVIYSPQGEMICVCAELP